MFRNIKKKNIFIKVRDDFLKIFLCEYYLVTLTSFCNKWGKKHAHTSSPFTLILDKHFPDCFFSFFFSFLVTLYYESNYTLGLFGLLASLAPLMRNEQIQAHKIDFG